MAQAGGGCHALSAAAANGMAVRGQRPVWPVDVPGSARARHDEREQSDHEPARAVQPPFVQAPGPALGEAHQCMNQEEPRQRPGENPNHAVGHERLLPEPDPRQDDQHRGDEQQHNHGGHNADANRRRFDAGAGGTGTELPLIRRPVRHGRSVDSRRLLCALLRMAGGGGRATLYRLRGR